MVPQQQLRDLHRVGRRALTQVVGDDEQRQAPFLREVLADATHQRVVVARAEQRHRVDVLGQIVDDLHSRRRAEHLARALGGQVLAEREVRGLGVAVEDGHAHAGRRDAQIGQGHDLARLVDHLHLLLRVPVRVRRADLGEQVEGDAVGELLRGRLLHVEEGAALLLQLVDALLAGAGDGLVGGDHHALQARGLVQRLQDHDQLDGRAIRVGDDAAPAGLERQLDGPRVHLGDDQRHVGVHAERGRIVHHPGAGASGIRGELAGDGRAGREERDVHAVERLGPQAADGQLLTAELQLVAFAALGSERHQLGHREFPVLEHLEHLPPHRPRRPRHRHFHSTHLILASLRDVMPRATPSRITGKEHYRERGRLGSAGAFCDPRDSEELVDSPEILPRSLISRAPCDVLGQGSFPTRPSRRATSGELGWK